MLVKINEIPETGLSVTGEISSKEMGVHEVSFKILGETRLDLFLEIVDHFFIAKGAYETVVSCNCDRCLTVFEQRIINDKYLFSAETTGCEGETIDLTDGIREDILLCLPLKILCSEDCRGFCPICGADLNHEKCSCRPGPGVSPFSELDKLL